MRDPAERMLAEFRGLADQMAVHRRSTLLSDADAASELGLSLAQFEAQYVSSGLVDVYEEPGRKPRVPASQIRRLKSELRDMPSNRGDGSKKPRRSGR